MLFEAEAPIKLFEAETPVNNQTQRQKSLSAKIVESRFLANLMAILYIAMFTDGLLKHSSKPQLVAGIVGLVIVVIGLLCFFVRKIKRPYTLCSLCMASLSLNFIIRALCY